MSKFVSTFSLNFFNFILIYFFLISAIRPFTYGYIVLSFLTSQVTFTPFLILWNTALCDSYLTTFLSGVHPRSEFQRNDTLMTIGRLFVARAALWRWAGGWDETSYMRIDLARETMMETHPSSHAQGESQITQTIGLDELPASSQSQSTVGWESRGMHDRYFKPAFF